MSWRLRRAAVFLGFMLALCAFSRVASAMPAGLCDDRGASAIAPSPSLQVPDLAIARWRAPAMCPREQGLARATIAPAHRVLASVPNSTDHTAPLAAVFVSPATGERLRLDHHADGSLLAVRWRVERPPRV